jgi:GGDEF domain-containing protein
MRQNPHQSEHPSSLELDIRELQFLHTAIAQAGQRRLAEQALYRAKEQGRDRVGVP